MFRHSPALHFSFYAPLSVGSLGSRELGDTIDIAGSSVRRQREYPLGVPRWAEYIHV